MRDEDEVLSPAVGPPMLQPNLFSGTSCPLFTGVWLSDIALPPSEAVPCFSCVTELRLWPDADLLSPVTPGVFLHFPALRRLRLEQLEIIRKFRTSDLSRLEYIELFDDFWDLAEETAWPLESLPHVLADSSECNYFLFLPLIVFERGHIVFEPHSDDRAGAIRFGNDDWTFTRGCGSDLLLSDAGHRGIDTSASFDCQLDDAIAEGVHRRLRLSPRAW